MLTTEDLQRRVARRIRELARARLVSVAHLADRAGVSRSHLRGVLSCAAGTTVAWLTRVANALEVAPGDLVARRSRRAAGASARTGRMRSGPRPLRR